MDNFKYYAVKNGFRPGVYPTWRSAKRQVHGCRGAVYKGFNTLDAAEAFAGMKSGVSGSFRDARGGAGDPSGIPLASCATSTLGPGAT